MSICGRLTLYEKRKTGDKQPGAESREKQKSDLEQRTKRKLGSHGKQGFAAIARKKLNFPPRTLMGKTVAKDESVTSM